MLSIAQTQAILVIRGVRTHSRHRNSGYKRYTASLRLDIASSVILFQHVYMTNSGFPPSIRSPDNVVSITQPPVNSIRSIKLSTYLEWAATLKPSHLFEENVEVLFYQTAASYPAVQQRLSLAILQASCSRSRKRLT